MSLLYVPVTDARLLHQVCSALRDIYTNSAPLQYAFTLETSAYVDVPNLPIPPPPAVLPSAPSDDSSSTSSPHTGKARATIPSVTLAPYAQHPPPKPSGSSLPSTMEKNKMLVERERRWETMNSEYARTFNIAGPAGVYEMQEGIFLMCDDYADENDGRVSEATSRR